MPSDQKLRETTIAFIDRLKQVSAQYGLAGSGGDYKVVTRLLLYKFFNDKFGYEVKHLDAGNAGTPPYAKRFRDAEKWDAEYNTFSDDEIEDLFDYLPPLVPRLRPEHTVAHLVNASSQGDFSALLDSTLLEIAALNEVAFSVSSSSGAKTKVFEPVSTEINDSSKRDAFARALVANIATFDFGNVFGENYDFFSGVFEYLLKDYNNDGGGKYAEYYTPRAIAKIMAELLVGANPDLRNQKIYDPAAGTGTLLMALAHQIGEDRCEIFSQDISAKSSELLRLNLILNNLSGSIHNVKQDDTLLNPAHKERDGATLRKFDLIVSNPPFKFDFVDTRDALAAQAARFWAGVPNKPAVVNPNKPKMAIYTCFLQHVINSLSAKGKAAVVVPTGFITAKSGIEAKILKKIVEERIVCGCVSMPSNVFATTGTNVSVLFLDKSASSDSVVLIDASKLGEDYKEGSNKKKRLRPEEIEKIVEAFRSKTPIDDFSVVVSYDQIREKNNSLSAGQYFDIKIDYVDISEEEFNARMENYKKELSLQFEESRRLEREILKQLGNLRFNEKVGKNSRE